MTSQPPDAPTALGIAPSLPTLDGPVVDAIVTFDPPSVPDGPSEPRPPVKGLKRLMWTIIPANLGIFMLWGAIPGILLPQQVTLTFGTENQANVANLAIITTIGAFAAMLAQPIAGQVSDRTRSRFGRRAPWMVIGALAGSLALIGLAFADKLWGFIIAWTLVHISFNFAQGPLSAVMPDRVPLGKRGTFASLVGIGTMVGMIGGQVIGSVFFNNIRLGYIIFATFAVLMLISFVLINPDYPSTDIKPEPFSFKEFLGTFWFNPKKHPDFGWAFLGRFLLTAGFQIVTGYQLYLLQFYFHVEEPQKIIPILGLLTMVGMVISTIVSGPLSDKIGKRKPFVFGSAAFVSIAFVIPWMWQDITAWMIMMFLSGFGFGMYQAVDTALISEVLPSKDSYAKDLGIVNIAATLPQTLAPAIAGAIVLTMGYRALFPIAIVLGLLGAVAIWPIKSVK